MLRKNIVSICVVSFILLAAGFAFGAAVKVGLVPYDLNGPPEPKASGHIILNYDSDADVTQVQVNGKRLKSETEYTVYLTIEGTITDIGSFITKKGGAGHLHVKLDGDVTDVRPIYLNDTDLNLTVLAGE